MKSTRLEIPRPSDEVIRCPVLVFAFLAVVAFGLLLSGCSAKPAPRTAETTRQVTAAQSGVKQIGEAAIRQKSALQKTKIAFAAARVSAPAATAALDEAIAENERLITLVATTTEALTGAQAAVEALRRDIAALEDRHAAQLAAEKKRTATEARAREIAENNATRERAAKEKEKLAHGATLSALHKMKNYFATAGAIAAAALVMCVTLIPLPYRLGAAALASASVFAWVWNRF